VKAQISDAEVARYFAENKEFFDKVMVQASHIVIRLSSNAPQSERQAARVKLQALRQEIVAGKIDFAEAAKKYSQCPTAPRGGDLGYFPRKFAVEESFARAAFGLQKGEVSDIVESEYGLHLIKCTDRKPGAPANFDKIKDDVREIAAEEMQQNLLREQRKLAKVTVYLGQDQPKTPQK
jgi:parvulin-like peptidyl-prolyl isomerase